MWRLLLFLSLTLLAVWFPNRSVYAQYYPYPPGYYAPGYYPPSYYRPPPPPAYYGPPAYSRPYYSAPPAYSSANCGTRDEPKPCYR
jgi:hypothetical protein